MRSQKKAATQLSDADGSGESVTTRSFSQRSLFHVLIVDLALTLLAWTFTIYTTRNLTSAGSVVLQTLCWPRLQSA